MQSEQINRATTASTDDRYRLEIKVNNTSSGGVTTVPIKLALDLDDIASDHPVITGVGTQYNIPRFVKGNNDITRIENTGIEVRDGTSKKTVDGVETDIHTKALYSPQSDVVTILGHQNFHWVTGFIDDVRAYNIVPTTQYAGAPQNDIGTIGKNGYRWGSSHIKVMNAYQVLPHKSGSETAPALGTNSARWNSAHITTVNADNLVSMGNYIYLKATTGILLCNETIVELTKDADGNVINHGIRPNWNNNSYIGTSTYQFEKGYFKEIFENGTSLTDKYVDRAYTTMSALNNGGVTTNAPANLQSITASPGKDSLTIEGSNKWVRISATEGSGDVKDKISIGHLVPTKYETIKGWVGNNAENLELTWANTSFKVGRIYHDEAGHTTDCMDRTLKIPNTETTNTLKGLAPAIAKANTFLVSKSGTAAEWDSILVIDGGEANNNTWGIFC